MSQSPISTLLTLRLLIGFLGERAQFDWWPTAFFEPSSRLFLEPVFTKTTTLAQYHGVVEAARLIHDDHLSVGSFHLFRMPEEVEQDLHAFVLSDASAGLIAALPFTKLDSLAVLKRLAQQSGAEGTGPILVGNRSDFASPRVASSMAAIYHSGFIGGVNSYPYLAE